VTAPIRVVVCDDQMLIRTGLVTIIDAQTDLEVVGECGDGQAAVDLAGRLAPDVVVMDIRMPVLDGIEATRRLCALPEMAPILVLTTFDEDELLWGAIEAGASGFVLKASTADELIAAVRAVAGGAAWFDSSVAPRVLETYRRDVAPARRSVQRLEELTGREHDVLRLLSRGATNAEIAGELHVSQATVKTHVGSIFMKLGVRDRAAAIVYAFDHGVV
jgi:DNA-binding NarL/FixJ family response regulator